MNNCNIGINSGQVYQYFVTKLTTAPTEVEFKAVKSYRFLNILVMIASLMIFLTFGKIAYSMINNINISLFIAASLTMFFIFFSISSINSIMLKLPSLNIKYKNKTVTIDGVEYKFYEDIWDITYQKNLLNICSSSAVLNFYIISPKSKTPISFAIKFEQDAKAKYIYDLFHSKK